MPAMDFEEGRPAVYMMGNKPRGKILIGVTTRLCTQVSEHKARVVPGAARKHGLTKLVWYEHHNSMESALWRQKRLKGLHMAWKIYLIETTNPEWDDLHSVINPEVMYRALYQTA